MSQCLANAFHQTVSGNYLVMWLQDRFHGYSYMSEFRNIRRPFHSSECILYMLSTKPEVVLLHTIVRCLYEVLHVFSRTCSIYAYCMNYSIGGYIQTPQCMTLVLQLDVENKQNTLKRRSNLKHLSTTLLYQVLFLDFVEHRSFIREQNASWIKHTQDKNEKKLNAIGGTSPVHH